MEKRLLDTRDEGISFAGRQASRESRADSEAFDGLGRSWTSRWTSGRHRLVKTLSFTELRRDTALPFLGTRQVQLHRLGLRIPWPRYWQRAEKTKGKKAANKTTTGGALTFSPHYIFHKQ